MRTNQEIKKSIKELRNEINTYCTINGLAKTQYYVTIENCKKIKFPIDAKDACNIEGGSVMLGFLLQEEADLNVMLLQLVYRNYSIQYLEQKVRRLEEIYMIDHIMLDAVKEQFKHCYRSKNKARLVRLIEMSKEKIQSANMIIGDIV